MDDFQGALFTGEKGKPNGSYKWDNATEDAICNLYDQYVEVLHLLHLYLS